MLDRDCLSSAPLEDEDRKFVSYSLRAAPPRLRPPERQMIRPEPLPAGLHPRPPTLPDYRSQLLATRRQFSAAASFQSLERRWTRSTTARFPASDLLG